MTAPAPAPTIATATKRGVHDYVEVRFGAETMHLPLKAPSEEAATSFLATLPGARMEEVADSHARSDCERKVTCMVARVRGGKQPRVCALAYMRSLSRRHNVVVYALCGASVRSNGTYCSFRAFLENHSLESTFSKWDEVEKRLSERRAERRRETTASVTALLALGKSGGAAPAPMPAPAPTPEPAPAPAPEPEPLARVEAAFDERVRLAIAARDAAHQQFEARQQVVESAIAELKRASEEQARVVADETNARIERVVSEMRAQATKRIDEIHQKAMDEADGLVASLQDLLDKVQSASTDVASAKSAREKFQKATQSLSAAMSELEAVGVAVTPLVREKRKREDGVADVDGKRVETSA